MFAFSLIFFRFHMWCGGGGGRCGVGASMGAFAGVYSGGGGFGSGYVNAGRAKLFILFV